MTGEERGMHRAPSRLRQASYWRRSIGDSSSAASQQTSNLMTCPPAWHQTSNFRKPSLVLDRLQSTQCAYDRPPTAYPGLSSGPIPEPASALPSCTLGKIYPKSCHL